MLTLGCNPKPNNSDLLKHFSTITNYIDTVNFSNKKTYWLQLDTISYFNSQSNAQTDTLQCLKCTGNNNQLGQYANIITTEIKAKLDAAGYVAVNGKQNPDMKVYVTVIENYSLYQTYTYYPYGYGYGYGYYGGYYGGYGGYYPSVGVSDVASLYIVVFDLKHSYQGKPNQIWIAQAGDLVSSPNLYDLSVEAVDQAFKQSPYFKK